MAVVDPSPVHSRAVDEYPENCSAGCEHRCSAPAEINPFTTECFLPPLHFARSFLLLLRENSINNRFFAQNLKYSLFAYLFFSSFFFFFLFREKTIVRDDYSLNDNIIIIIIKFYNFYIIFYII